MKNMKKLFSLALALVMMMALVVTAGAASGTNDDSGKITINDAIPGQDYSAYQLLVLESYNEANKAYAYKVSTKWSGFFATEEAKQYVTIDGQGYVSWVKDADAAAFAKAALAYAKGETVKDTTIAADKTATAGAAAEDKEFSTVEFSGLNLGYYLLDSSAGALCSLDTTNPNVTIEEKNEVPTVEKEQRLPEFNVKIGDTVNYTITISVPEGAQAYVLEDTMGVGLSLDTLKGITIAAKNADITLPKGSTIEFTNNGFKISFTQEYLDEIAGKTDLVVTYAATITSVAAVVDSTGKPSITLDNKAILNYGTNKKVETGKNETHISLFQFPVVKVDSKDVALADAQFDLYTQKEGGSPIPLVYDTQKNAYRAATEDEQAEDGFVSAKITSTASQPAMVYGFGAGTYYLEETAAPSGYNKLTGRAEVTLSDMNLTGNPQTRMSQDADGNPVTIYVYEAGYGTSPKIVNQTGTELPSTGGIGTTIFTVTGAVLMIGAAVLFLTKKRSEA